LIGRSRSVDRSIAAADRLIVSTDGIDIDIESASTERIGID
jgi:hypothetical protein